MAGTPPAVPAQSPELVTAPSAPVRETPAPAAAPVPQIAGDAEAIAKAERLARIVVSDIILYNPEKFEAAVRAGNVAEAMAVELAEGRSLFIGRIEASVREHRDFLIEELLRVARERESS